MTNIEKNKVYELYSKGYGYKRIAKDLNVSVGSVRNILVKTNEEFKCRYCGNKLSFIEGKKKKIYCCDSCRYSYWNKKRKEDKKHGN